MNRRLILALTLLAASPAFATKVVHQNVVDMSRLAGTVFVGTCVDAVQEAAPLGTASVPCTRYEFDVLDPVKGVQGSRVTLRQLGTTSGPGHVVGMPVYRPGETYLLFLLPESAVGLTSPVGLHQGAFLVVVDQETPRFLNPQDNLGLFQGVDLSSTSLTPEEQRLVAVKRGGLAYATFLGLVRKLVAE